jgi:hypothetical protein
VNAAPLPLASFQEWMQAVIVHPDGVEAGLRSGDARRHVDPAHVAGVVRPHGALDATARLGIYASMYPLRTVEALRSDYPALAALLGERDFARLVRDYVAALPSTSYTLARLGDALPAFVATWGSRRGRSLRAGVARLERAAAAVFDAEETTRPGADALAAAISVSGGAARFVAAPAFALVRVPCGAIDVLDAFLEGSTLPTSAGRGTARVAFYRREFTVLRRTLEPLAARLLEALVAGVPLDEAIAAATGKGRRPSAEEVAAWIPEWVSLGFFSRVEAAPAGGD